MDELLALLQGRPEGVSIGAIAKAMGVRPDAIRAVLAHMVATSRIALLGKGSSSRYVVRPEDPAGASALRSLSQRLKDAVRAHSGGLLAREAQVLLGVPKPMFLLALNEAELCGDVCRTGQGAGTRLIDAAAARRRKNVTAATPHPVTRFRRAHERR